MFRTIAIAFVLLLILPFTVANSQTDGNSNSVVSDGVNVVWDNVSFKHIPSLDNKDSYGIYNSNPVSIGDNMWVSNYLSQINYPSGNQTGGSWTSSNINLIEQKDNGSFEKKWSIGASSGVDYFLDDVIVKDNRLHIAGKFCYTHNRIAFESEPLVDCSITDGNGNILIEGNEENTSDSKPYVFNVGVDGELINFLEIEPSSDFATPLLLKEMKNGDLLYVGSSFYLLEETDQLNETGTEMYLTALLISPDDYSVIWQNKISLGRISQTTLHPLYQLQDNIVFLIENENINLYYTASQSLLSSGDPNECGYCSNTSMSMIDYSIHKMTISHNGTIISLNEIGVFPNSQGITILTSVSEADDKSLLLAGLYTHYNDIINTNETVTRGGWFVAKIDEEGGVSWSNTIVSSNGGIGVNNRIHIVTTPSGIFIDTLIASYMNDSVELLFGNELALIFNRTGEYTGIEPYLYNIIIAELSNEGNWRWVVSPLSEGNYDTEVEVSIIDDNVIKATIVPDHITSLSKPLEENRGVTSQFRFTGLTDTITTNLTGELTWTFVLGPEANNSEVAGKAIDDDNTSLANFARILFYSILTIGAPTILILHVSQIISLRNMEKSIGRLSAKQHWRLFFLPWTIKRRKGDLMRNRILIELKNGEKYSSQLSRKLRTSKTNIQHHLRHLEIEGKVFISKTKGNVVYYKLHPWIEEIEPGEISIE